MQKFEFTDTEKYCKAELYIDGESVCKCQIDHDEEGWTISSWYTKKGEGNKGYGKSTMAALVSHMKDIHGLPADVKYLWNGANPYVYDWLEKNFGATSMCPLAVQKYASDDDWLSHIYTLNKEKFFLYFGIN